MDTETREVTEEMLRSYASYTQFLLPREGDQIKIEQNGETWLILHAKSRATIRATRLRMLKNILQGVSFVVTGIAITLVARGFQLAPTPGTRAVGGGIVLLAFAAWLTWSVQVPVPREDSNAQG